MPVGNNSATVKKASLTGDCSLGRSRNSARPQLPQCTRFQWLSGLQSRSPTHWPERSFAPPIVIRRVRLRRHPRDPQGRLGHPSRQPPAPPFAPEAKERLREIVEGSSSGGSRVRTLSSEISIRPQRFIGSQGDDRPAGEAYNHFLTRGL